MIQASLIDSKTGKELYIGNQNGYKVLISQTHAQVDGKFNAETLTDVGTVIVAEPNAGGCIVMTDLILTTNKNQSTIVTVQYTDGITTIPIISADITDAPCHIASPFAGYWKGWKNARVELVLSGGITPTATCAIGYFKLHDSMLYGEWDAQR